MYVLVPREWLMQWRRFLESSSEPRPPALTLNGFHCNCYVHGDGEQKSRWYPSPALMEFLQRKKSTLNFKDDRALEVVTEKEREELRAIFPDAMQMPRLMVGEGHVLQFSPEYCRSCFEQCRRERLEKKLA